MRKNFLVAVFVPLPFNSTPLTFRFVSTLVRTFSASCVGCKQMNYKIMHMEEGRQPMIFNANFIRTSHITTVLMWFFLFRWLCRDCFFPSIDKLVYVINIFGFDRRVSLATLNPKKGSSHFAPSIKFWFFYLC